MGAIRRQCRDRGRRATGRVWASPIQCYLELSKLDKREREIAATVREAILKKLK